MATVLRIDFRGTRMEVERPSPKEVILVRDDGSLDQGNDSVTGKKKEFRCWRYFEGKDSRTPEELNEG